MTSAEEIYKVLGYSGNMAIMCSIKEGKNRFTEIMFKTNINPGILRRCLITMMKISIITHDEKSKRYLLTEKGEKVYNISKEIAEIFKNTKINKDDFSVYSSRPSKIKA